jgi:hypothetical protein
MHKESILAVGALFFGMFALYTVHTKVPRLVGYECLGTSGPIYANEEDDFPPCLAIEAYRRG